MIGQQSDRTVVFSGDATIRQAERIHGELLAALAPGMRIAVDCAGVAEVDLSFVQQILAARRSAERAGGLLAIAPPASGPLLDVLARGGFLADDGPFWTGGGA